MKPHRSANPTAWRPSRSSSTYLRFLLTESRPTPSALAAEADVSVPFISMVLAGRKLPSEKVMAAAERLTGLPRTVLFAEMPESED